MFELTVRGRVFFLLPHFKSRQAYHVSWWCFNGGCRAVAFQKLQSYGNHAPGIITQAATQLSEAVYHPEGSSCLSLTKRLATMS